MGGYRKSRLQADARRQMREPGICRVSKLFSANGGELEATCFCPYQGRVASNLFSPLIVRRVLLVAFFVRAFSFSLKVGINPHQGQGFRDMGSVAAQGGGNVGVA